MASGRSKESRNRHGRTAMAANESQSTPDVKTEKSSPSCEAPQKIDAIAAATHEQDADRLMEMMTNSQTEMDPKDELIAALVHELEQAVEQLDRFKRSGADRSHPPLSSNFGFATEPVEPQVPNSADFRRMVEEWEEEKPCALLNRIESQLAAVHDLVLGMRRDDRPRDGYHEIEDRVRQIYREPDTTVESSVSDVTIDESAASWESIKKQILGGETSSESMDDGEDHSELLRLMSETPTPREVDFETTDLEVMKMAVIERDAYIIQLNRLYRTRNSLAIPTDWATLANVPAEMQLRVETLTERLDVQIRLGEVEMSLERARLARERSQIQAEREQIEKHLRRLGLNSLAELDNISAAPGSATDRRWMRFLGPNTK